MTMTRHALRSPCDVGQTATPLRDLDYIRGWRFVAVWVAALLGPWAVVGALVYAVIWIARGFA